MKQLAPFVCKIKYYDEIENKEGIEYAIIFGESYAAAARSIEADYGDSLENLFLEKFADYNSIRIIEEQFHAIMEGKY